MMSFDEVEQALVEARSAVSRARRALVTAELALQAAQGAVEEVKFARAYDAVMAEYRALTSPIVVPDGVPDEWSRD